MLNFDQNWFKSVYKTKFGFHPKLNTEITDYQKWKQNLDDTAFANY